MLFDQASPFQFKFILKKSTQSFNAIKSQLDSQQLVADLHERVNYAFRILYSIGLDDDSIIFMSWTDKYA